MKTREVNMDTKNLKAILDDLKQGRPEALARLRDYAHENPQSEHAWAHLAWNLNGQGFIEEAHSASTHLLTLLPDSADAHRLYAQTCFLLGKMDSAIKALQKSIACSDDPYPYQVELIELLLHSGRPFSAWREYRSLKKKRTTHRHIPAKLLHKILANTVFILLARILFIPSLRNRMFLSFYHFFTVRNRWGEASILARSVASIDTRNSLWPENAAECIYRKRNPFHPEFDKEIFWRTRAYHTGGNPAAYLLARAHLHAGHAHAALSLLEKENLITWEEKEIYAHACTAEGEYEKAVSCYDELGKWNPVHSLNAGIVLLYQGKYSQALPRFEAILKKQPQNPLALFLHHAARKSVQTENPQSVDVHSLIPELAKQNHWIDWIGEHRNDWESYRDSLLKTGRYQTIPCPECNANDFMPLYLDPVPEWIRGRCHQCGLHYVNPQPLPETIPHLYTHKNAQESALHDFFRQTLNQLRAQPKEEAAEMFARAESWWHPQFSLPDFEKQRGPDRYMLDIGCSVGSTLLNYQNRGWNAYGIDLDEQAVQVAQSAGLKAQVCTLENVAFENESMDLITMMDVIEHVPEHQPGLKKIYSLLKPGGILKLKTPCVESIVHYYYGPQWESNDTHLLYFSRPLLLQILKNCGFEIVATRSYLEANKLAHTYDRWRRFSITPLFDALVMDWDIGDTLLVLAKKPET